jgi:zinc protease
VTVRERLPNGLTVIVRRDTAAPVVAIVTHVRAGYFDESDDVVGIAHVLEHMYFKGTPTRGVGEIARQTKASGGYLNASTIYDQTVYYTVLPASSLANGLDIQSDAWANSVIDGEELARELEVIIQEAKRKSDSAGAIVSESLFELLHDRHRIRRWRIGNEPGLRALRREHLLAFYRNFYKPSNTILSIVGDVDVEHALDLVRARYGPVPRGLPDRVPGPAENGTAGFRFREMSGDVQQSEFAFGWRTPGTLHEDTVKLDLAGLVLGTGRASRLYRAVRERQLAASVSAYNYTPTELGVFLVRAETPPERVLDAARATWDQVMRLRDDGVSAGEVTRAQRLFESRWLRRLETMDGQATHLAEWEALGGWELGDAYAERMLALGPDDVLDAVRRHLDPDRAGWLLYRPEQDAPVVADAASARALLERVRPAPLDRLPALEPIAAPNGVPARAVRFEEEEFGVRVYRTARGEPILVRRRPGAGLVHIGLLAMGGASREDAALSGLTTLMARTAIKGTALRSATRIAEESELLGGAIEPTVMSDGFGWSLSVPVGRLREALALLADVVQHPVFPEEALETERTIALANVAHLRDDMFQYPFRLATSAAYGEHPYGRSPLGSEAGLEAVTVEALREWHATHVLRAPCAIGVVGDVDADEVAALVAQAFGEFVAMELEPLELPVWPAETRVTIESRDKAQSALAIMFDGPARDDDARYTAGLIAAVASGLGGRFFNELREKRSLAYTVHASASHRLRGGMFMAYIATSPEREEEARAGLLAEFARLRDEPVGEDELRRAQEYTIGLRAIGRQGGKAALGEMINAWLFGTGLAELEVFEQRVRAVSTSGMRALARSYFDESRRVEGVVRGVGRAV